MENINRATAVYTGGNQYCYYAELDNGNWIMGGDEWLTVVDCNPLLNKWKNEYGYESDYYEWQIEHLIRPIEDSEYQEVLNRILNVIINGNTIKDFDNFSIEDLKLRIE